MRLLLLLLGLCLLLLLLPAAAAWREQTEGVKAIAHFHGSWDNVTEWRHGVTGRIHRERLLLPGAGLPPPPPPPAADPNADVDHLLLVCGAADRGGLPGNATVALFRLLNSAAAAGVNQSNGVMPADRAPQLLWRYRDANRTCNGVHMFVSQELGGVPKSEGGWTKPPVKDAAADGVAYAELFHWYTGYTQLFRFNLSTGVAEEMRSFAAMPAIALSRDGRNMAVTRPGETAGMKLLQLPSFKVVFNVSTNAMCCSTAAPVAHFVSLPENGQHNLSTSADEAILLVVRTTGSNKQGIALYDETTGAELWQTELTNAAGLGVGNGDVVYDAAVDDNSSLIYVYAVNSSHHTILGTYNHAGVRQNKRTLGPDISLSALAVAPRATAEFFRIGHEGVDEPALLACGNTSTATVLLSFGHRGEGTQWRAVSRNMTGTCSALGFYNRSSAVLVGGQRAIRGFGPTAKPVLNATAQGLSVMLPTVSPTTAPTMLPTTAPTNVQSQFLNVTTTVRARSSRVTSWSATAVSRVHSSLMHLPLYDNDTNAVALCGHDVASHELTVQILRASTNSTMHRYTRVGGSLRCLDIAVHASSPHLERHAVYVVIGVGSVSEVLRIPLNTTDFQTAANATGATRSVPMVNPHRCDVAFDGDVLVLGQVRDTEGEPASLQALNVSIGEPIAFAANMWWTGFNASVFGIGPEAAEEDFVQVSIADQSGFNTRVVIALAHSVKLGSFETVSLLAMLQLSDGKLLGNVTALATEPKIFTSVSPDPVSNGTHGTLYVAGSDTLPGQTNALLNSYVMSTTSGIGAQLITRSVGTGGAIRHQALTFVTAVAAGQLADSLTSPFDTQNTTAVIACSNSTAAFTQLWGFGALAEGIVWTGGSPNAGTCEGLLVVKTIANNGTGNTAAQDTLWVTGSFEEPIQGNASVNRNLTDGAIFSVVPRFITASPSNAPTAAPTSLPTGTPSASPTPIPSALPTKPPTQQPTSSPSSFPSASPSASPSSYPSWAPTSAPTRAPTTLPEMFAVNVSQTMWRDRRGKNHYAAGWTHTSKVARAFSSVLGGDWVEQLVVCGYATTSVFPELPAAQRGPNGDKDMTVAAFEAGSGTLLWAFYNASMNCTGVVIPETAARSDPNVFVYVATTLAAGSSTGGSNSNKNGSIMAVSLHSGQVQAVTWTPASHAISAVAVTANGEAVVTIESTPDGDNALQLYVDRLNLSEPVTGALHNVSSLLFPSSVRLSDLVAITGEALLLNAAANDTVAVVAGGARGPASFASAYVTTCALSLSATRTAASATGVGLPMKILWNNTFSASVPDAMPPVHLRRLAISNTNGSTQDVYALVETQTGAYIPMHFLFAWRLSTGAVLLSREVRTNAFSSFQQVTDVALIALDDSSADAAGGAFTLDRALRGSPSVPVDSVVLMCFGGPSVPMELAAWSFSLSKMMWHYTEDRNYTHTSCAGLVANSSSTAPFPVLFTVGEQFPVWKPSATSFAAVQALAMDLDLQTAAPSSAPSLAPTPLPLSVYAAAIVAPDTVAVCSDVTLDATLSLSTACGGHNISFHWNSTCAAVRADVQSTPTAQVTLQSDWLRTCFSTEGLSRIDVTVTLVDEFFGETANAANSTVTFPLTLVEENVPTVQIRGLNTIVEAEPGEAVTSFMQLTQLPCNTSGTTATLSYSWAVAGGDASALAPYLAANNDPTKFIIPRNTQKVGANFTVLAIITVTDTASATVLNGTAALQIQYVQPELVACIRGGDTSSVQVWTYLDNATLRYVALDPGSSETNLSTRIEMWDIQQASLVHSATVLRASSENERTYQIPGVAFLEAVGQTFRVVISVTSLTAGDTRAAASADATWNLDLITINADVQDTSSTSSYLLHARWNQDKTLALEASLPNHGTASAADVSFYWELVSSTAAAPIGYLGATTNRFLTVDPETLVGGRSYEFHVLALDAGVPNGPQMVRRHGARRLGQGVLGEATISVVVNDKPRNGYMRAQPSHNISAFVQDVQLAAVSFCDAEGDLPLGFAFFVASTEVSSASSSSSSFLQVLLSSQTGLNTFVTRFSGAAPSALVDVDDDDDDDDDANLPDTLTLLTVGVSVSDSLGATTQAHTNVTVQSNLTADEYRQGLVDAIANARAALENDQDGEAAIGEAAVIGLELLQSLDVLNGSDIGGLQEELLELVQDSLDVIDTTDSAALAQVVSATKVLTATASFLRPQGRDSALGIIARVLTAFSQGESGSAGSGASGATTSAASDDDATAGTVQPLPVADEAVLGQVVGVHSNVVNASAVSTDAENVSDSIRAQLDLVGDLAVRDVLSPGQDPVEFVATHLGVSVSEVDAFTFGQGGNSAEDTTTYAAPQLALQPEGAATFTVNASALTNVTNALEACGQQDVGAVVVSWFTDPFSFDTFTQLISRVSAMSFRDCDANTITVAGLSSTGGADSVRMEIPLDESLLNSLLLSDMDTLTTDNDSAIRNRVEDEVVCTEQGPLEYECPARPDSADSTHLVTCEDKNDVITVVCPTVWTFGYCIFWDGREWSNDGCVPVGYNASKPALLCACSHLTEFGSTGASYATQFRDTTESIGSLNMRDLVENPAVAICLVALWAIYGCFLFFGERFDTSDNAQTVAVMLSATGIAPTVPTKRHRHGSSSSSSRSSSSSSGGGSRMQSSGSGLITRLRGSRRSAGEEDGKSTDGDGDDEAEVEDGIRESSDPSSDRALAKLRNAGDVKRRGGFALWEERQSFVEAPEDLMERGSFSFSDGDMDSTSCGGGMSGRGASSYAAGGAPFPTPPPPSSSSSASSSLPLAAAGTPGRDAAVHSEGADGETPIAAADAGGGKWETAKRISAAWKEAMIENHPLLSIGAGSIGLFPGVLTALSFRYKVTILFAQVLGFLFIATVLFQAGEAGYEEWHTEYENRAGSSSMVAVMFENIWEGLITAVLYLPINYLLTTGFKSCSRAQLAAAIFGDVLVAQRHELLRATFDYNNVPAVYSLVQRLEALSVMYKAELAVLRRHSPMAAARFDLRMYIPIRTRVAKGKAALRRARAVHQEVVATAKARALAEAGWYQVPRVHLQYMAFKRTLRETEIHTAYLDSLSESQRREYLTDQFLLAKYSAMPLRDAGFIKGPMYRMAIMDTSAYADFRSQRWLKPLILGGTALTMLFCTLYVFSFAVQWSEAAVGRALLALLLSVILDMLFLQPSIILWTEVLLPYLTAAWLANDIVEARDFAWAALTGGGSGAVIGAVAAAGAASVVGTGATRQPGGRSGDTGDNLAGSTTGASQHAAAMIVGAARRSVARGAHRSSGGQSRGSRGSRGMGNVADVALQREGETSRQPSGMRSEQDDEHSAAGSDADAAEAMERRPGSEPSSPSSAGSGSVSPVGGTGADGREAGEHDRGSSTRLPDADIDAFDYEIARVEDVDRVSRVLRLQGAMTRRQDASFWLGRAQRRMIRAVHTARGQFAETVGWTRPAAADGSDVGAVDTSADVADASEAGGQGEGAEANGVADEDEDSDEDSDFWEEIGQALTVTYHDDVNLDPHMDVLSPDALPVEQWQAEAEAGADAYRTATVTQAVGNIFTGSVAREMIQRQQQQRTHLALQQRRQRQRARRRRERAPRSLGASSGAVRITGQSHETSNPARPARRRAAGGGAGTTAASSAAGSSGLEMVTLDPADIQRALSMDSVIASPRTARRETAL